MLLTKGTQTIGTLAIGPILAHLALWLFLHGSMGSLPWGDNYLTLRKLTQLKSLNVLRKPNRAS